MASQPDPPCPCPESTKRLLACRAGAAAIEYCILAACVAVSLLGALLLLGPTTGEAMNGARNGMHRGTDFALQP